MKTRRYGIATKSETKKLKPIFKTPLFLYLSFLLDILLKIIIFYPSKTQKNTTI